MGEVFKLPVLHMPVYPFQQVFPYPYPFIRVDLIHQIKDIGKIIGKKNTFVVKKSA